MIPKNILRYHVIEAIREIDSHGVPKRRKPTGYSLVFEGKEYPPKLVLSIANKFANAEELASNDFSGGNETNSFLRKLGFEISELSKEKGKEISSIGERINRKKGKKHDERCPKCKEIIGKLLEKIYDKVKQNYRLDIGTAPDDFKHTPYYEKLLEIYKALQNYRGFKEFIRTKNLPHCDFFVLNPGIIVEFDESQHFTLPRKITLAHYKENLELGFEMKRWMALCERINAKDNNPPFRDEQRAWYDTLRDFLPLIKNMKPTIRLYAKDFVWCSLDADSPSDVKIFKNLLKGETGGWEIEVREESTPFLARIIIADEWDGNPEKAKKLLEDVYKKWPKGKKVKFLITCGGFIQFDWPESMSLENIGNNKNPNKDTVDDLMKKAEKSVRYVLSAGLNEKLREFTDYITLGIDSYKEKISKTQNYIPKLHVELVCLIDLRNDKFYWTGKSYPTSNQEDGLVRIPDLERHFFELRDVGKVMILGCHDITVFNPMSRMNPNTAVWRIAVNNEFRELAKKEKPICVLHHPHTTVKVRTWLNAWSGLRKILPSVKQHVGAGRYYEADRKRSDWDAIEGVLESTKCGNTIDFIVYMLRSH